MARVAGRRRKEPIGCVGLDAIFKSSQKNELVFVFGTKLVFVFGHFIHIA